jgi:hypothetical protein
MLLHRLASLSCFVVTCSLVLPTRWAMHMLWCFLFLLLLVLIFCCYERLPTIVSIMHPSSISLFLRFVSRCVHIQIFFSDVRPCHASPHILCQSTNFFCLLNHISVLLVSYNHLDLFVVFLVDFVCRLGYSFLFWGTLCVILVSFLVFSLLDQGHSFDVTVYVIIILSFHYLPFVVVHYIISFVLYSMTTLKS